MMKKALLINIVAFIMVSFTATSSADSLSTSHTIRLYLRVVSEEETESVSDTVDMASIDEDKESETPAPEPTGGAPKNYMSNPFSNVVNAVRSVFFSLTSPSKEMQRKY